MLVHIISPTKSTYINATPIIITIGITNALLIDEIKFEILLSDNGSNKAPVNFKASINKMSCNSGRRIVANNIKSPDAPIAFLISKQLAKITFKPSLKYPPKIGTYVLKENLAVLKLIESIEPAVIPLIAKKPIKIVKTIPIIHLNSVFKKLDNFCNRTEFDKL